jgi:predicted nucleic acid-binding protein
MILLDTNVVVAFLNGDKSILKRIRVEIDEIGLSTLVVAERVTRLLYPLTSSLERYGQDLQMILELRV